MTAPSAYRTFRVSWELSERVAFNQVALRRGPSCAKLETGAPDIERLPMPTLVGKDYVAPRSFLEEHIAAIWRKALDSEAPISVEADFFEVGGNSLMAGKLIAAMRKQLKVRCRDMAHVDRRVEAVQRVRVERRL